MAGQYCDGFDENGQWEVSMGNLALEQSGSIVDMGQVPEWMRKQLNANVKAGKLVKWRGHWDSLSPLYGMGYANKAIWAYPEVAAEIIGAPGNPCKTLDPVQQVAA